MPSPLSVPRLFSTDIVEGIEDIAAVLEGVFLGTLQPLGMDRRQHLAAMGVFPRPRIADDAPTGDAADPLAKPEHRVDRGLEAPPSVPAEHKLVAVDVDVLLPQAVVGAIAQRLKSGAPTSTRCGRQRVLRAEVMGLVPALRRPLVGAVAVGDDQRFPLRVLRHEALERLSVGYLDFLQPHAARIELVDDLDDAPQRFRSGRSHYVRAN